MLIHSCASASGVVERFLLASRRFQASGVMGLIFGCCALMGNLFRCRASIGSTVERIKRRFSWRRQEILIYFGVVRPGYNL